MSHSVQDPDQNPGQRSGPTVLTFGCRLNTYESQAIKELATDAGMGPETFIVNTCAVTAEAERQAKQAIRRLRRENPDAKIIVTGCASQINPDQYAQMKEIDQVVGNDEKMKRETYQPDNAHARVLVNDIMAVKESAHHLVSGFEGRSRAFIQVQNGCDHRCTFCTIPYGRGNSRSVPVGEIVQQTRQLVASGYAEIVLTGVDITSYGADLPGQPKLGDMIQRLLRLVPEATRLRLSSLDPVEIDDTLWSLLGSEERLLPHLHLSLQAGDDMILKRMKRRHLRADAIAFCEQARRLRPDVVLGADLIAGFPTETEEMFENTLRCIDDCGLTFLHVFPFSARPHTPASRMPQLPGPLIKHRATMLRQKGLKREHHYLTQQIGLTQRFLIESCDQGRITGKTDAFAPLQIDTSEIRAVGSIGQARITAVHDQKLQGDLL